MITLWNCAGGFSRNVLTDVPSQSKNCQFAIIYHLCQGVAPTCYRRKKKEETNRSHYGSSDSQRDHYNSQHCILQSKGARRRRRRSRCQPLLRLDSIPPCVRVSSWQRGNRKRTTNKTTTSALTRTWRRRRVLWRHRTLYYWILTRGDYVVTTAMIPTKQREQR